MDERKRFIITLDGDWVLGHRTDEVLPITALAEFLTRAFDSDIAVENETFDELVLSVPDSIGCATVRRAVELFLSTEYDIEDDDGTASFTECDGLVSEQRESLGEASDDDRVSQCLDGIRELVGGEEFTALAEEIALLAPQIRANGTLDSFTYRSYLFAINDGHGLTTYATKLAQLISVLKLGKLSSSRAVIEEKLPPPKGEGTESFDSVAQILAGRIGHELSVLVIDVSEWMNKLRDRTFKDFLKKIESAMRRFVVIFRIPYVAKDVIDDVRRNIADVLSVRSVIFPPFGEKELRKCAAHELGRYGFTMRASAWGCFDERIGEEKSDGRFYGINTVRKVVRELIYNKQLSNAKRHRNDSVINKRDAGLLVASHIDEISGYEALAKLECAESVKSRIDEIIAQIEFATADKSFPAPCLHMRFVGNPGTGKTTVARIVGKILKEKGVLRTGNFFEYSGRDFCGRYVGETAPKTAGMCRDAYGSVLFIDEAYSLYRGDENDRDYGREALDTLIAEMENHRSDLVVIMAGYPDDMEKLMKGNAGLSGRMPYLVEFPDFSREQLYNTFRKYAEGKFVCGEGLFEAAGEYFYALSDEFISDREFGNARFVRNLFERTWAKASLRCGMSGKKKIDITKEDFLRAASDKEFAADLHARRKVGF